MRAISWEAVPACLERPDNLSPSYNPPAGVLFPSCYLRPHWLAAIHCPQAHASLLAGLAMNGVLRPGYRAAGAAGIFSQAVASASWRMSPVSLTYVAATGTQRRTSNGTVWFAMWQTEILRRHLSD